MKEVTGWLFDLYAHPRQGLVLWLMGDDRKPHSFTQPFQITFYIGGPFHRLRQVWKFLKDKPVSLSRTQRDDLHEGTQDVLEVNVFQPSSFDVLFKEVNQHFPDLLYYDVDLPLILRYAAQYGVFPFGHCKVKVKEGWEISEILSLDMPWDLDPKLPDLRVLQIRPDVNPSHASPQYLFAHFDQFKYRLSMDNPRELLFSLNGICDSLIRTSSSPVTEIHGYFPGSKEYQNKQRCPSTPTAILQKRLTEKKKSASSITGRPIIAANRSISSGAGISTIRTA
jgi:DNA polymerase-2